MDRILSVTLALVQTFLGVFGVRALYEQPTYAVVEHLAHGVEVRAYAERLVAETDARAQGDGEAFGRLFRYIGGANRDGTRIAMTAPVQVDGARIEATRPVERDAAGTMRFTLPRAVAAAGAPEPVDPGVRLVHVPAERLAVLRFTGRATAEARAEGERTLRAVLAAAGRAADGPAVFLGYDPPFAIPFLRRNEVALRWPPD